MIYSIFNVNLCYKKDVFNVNVLMIAISLSRSVLEERTQTGGSKLPTRQLCGGAELTSKSPTRQLCGGAELTSKSPTRQLCGGAELASKSPTRQLCGGAELASKSPTKQLCGGAEIAGLGKVWYLFHCILLEPEIFGLPPDCLEDLCKLIFWLFIRFMSLQWAIVTLT